jgi:hypothetical protein
MVGGRAGILAAAVAAEVGADDREAMGQQARHAPLHHMSLREAVQQQDRRSGTGSAQEDGRLSSLDFDRLKTVQHPNRQPAAVRYCAALGSIQKTSQWWPSRS